MVAARNNSLGNTIFLDAASEAIENSRRCPQCEAYVHRDLWQDHFAEHHPKFEPPKFPRFDYYSLDIETRIIVQGRTENIHNLSRKISDDIIQIGKDLIEVKGKLPHGMFEKWAEAEFGWSEQTRSNFMRIAEMVEQKSDYLTFLPTVLGLLAKPSTPEAARQAVLSQASSGQKVTVEKTKQTIIQHRGGTVARPGSRAGLGNPVTRPSPAPTYGKKTDDGYVPDVPSVELNDPPVSRLNHLPAVPPPPGIRSTVPNSMRPLSYVDTMAGGQASTTGAAPISPPPLGMGATPWHCQKLEDETWQVTDALGNEMCVITQKGLPGEMIAKQILISVNTANHVVVEPGLNELGEGVGLIPEQIDDLLEEFNPAPVRAVFNSLAAFEVTHRSAYSLALQWLMRMRNDVKGKTENSKGGDQYHAFIVALLAAYLKASEVNDAGIYERKTDRHQAQLLHIAGVRPEHIGDYVRAMQQQRYYQENAVPWQKVSKEIVMWLNRNCKDWRQVHTPETRLVVQYREPTPVPFEE